MTPNDRKASSHLIKNGKYFLPPPKNGSNLKELFQRLASAGAGRSVDEDGFPNGPWTPELLADAISQLDANQAGIELRTVQRWFQHNETGISTDNIRWLARVFGCGDPEATSEWQAELSAANWRLSEIRKENRKAVKQQAQSSPQIIHGVETTTVADIAGADLTNDSIWHFNLAKRTEALFSHKSSLSLPIVVFTAASALGLIAFTLDIHSILFVPTGGPAKQVGFLWAPNWTIVFLGILPMYLALLIDLLRRWKLEWRGKLEAAGDPALSTASWESSVAAASYSFWAILFITVVIASGYNWIATLLIPLLSGDAAGWPVDWARIALFRPDIISISSAIVFTSFVFLFNAFCAYLFFTGLIFLIVMTHDYLDVLNGLKSGTKKNPSQDVEKIRVSLINGIFRCTSLGMTITILMKLQSSFLLSENITIFDWLLADLHSIFNKQGTSSTIYGYGRSAPGNFYSFFSVLAIYTTFLYLSYRLRNPLEKPQFRTKLSISSLEMNGAMFLSMISYCLIGAFKGFTIVMLFSLIITIYVAFKPAFGQHNSIMED